MARLWRNTEGVSEGKYLVQRRDGTVPEWPWFVLGAKDPAASAALQGYADAAERLGYDPQYVADIRALSLDYFNYCADHGQGDPDAPRHREDDPVIIEKMRLGNGS